MAGAQYGAAQDRWRDGAHRPCFGKTSRRPARTDDGRAETVGGTRTAGARPAENRSDIALTRAYGSLRYPQPALLGKPRHHGHHGFEHERPAAGAALRPGA